tara:strand:+ start:2991 stop:4751 length:1761 start_codon:yes stop_codon:yes gene_type:complete
MFLSAEYLYAHNEQSKDLNQQAYQILQTRCYRCHGGSAKQAGLDVLSRANLLEERGETGSRFAWVVPGSVETSTLLDTLEPGPDSYMPKQGSPESKAMTDEEKQLLVNWVKAGAEFPVVENRSFISEVQILKAMRNHLLSAKADDRTNIRFYTLTHLYNNPSVSELDLRLYRAAFAKTLNSLTKRREVFIPEPLPETGESVYPVNLEELYWNRDDIWAEILSHYPYALKYDYVKDEELQQLWKDVSQFSGADVPYLRADWFIVTATQPPLYHLLLDIPQTLSELEHQLQLDITQNFLHGDLARSGYAKSGVSQQNRLLERHSTPATPYFWISYDFLPRRARGDLTRFPLGPVFPENPFNNQAFDHDGGEIIWSLPNGMQGYMLVDGKGNRINEGPVDVVFDRSAVLGTPSIINGISCIYCHRDGMISEFRDEIRHADAVGGKPREHVLKIYPTHEKMQSLTKGDREIFMRALEKVTGPYLLVGPDENKNIKDFPEPIGKVAEMYFRDLTPQQMALELGIQETEILQAKIEANRELLRYGLGTMIQDPPGTLKRDKWETREGTSLMQDIASELRMGVPYVSRQPIYE